MVADDPILMSGAGVFNVRELARELGPDRTAALVADAIAECQRGDAFRLSGEIRHRLECAARRLAQPEPAEPQWPERVWVKFWPDGSASIQARTWKAGGVPAVLVPLDGTRVVLSADGVRAMREELRLQASGYWNVAPYQCAGYVAALDRALAAGGGA